MQLARTALLAGSLSIARIQITRWVTYLSYSSITPTVPGHVFSVVFNPAAQALSLRNLTARRDRVSGFSGAAVAATQAGDVFAATDYNVLRLPAGSTNWESGQAPVCNGRGIGPHISPDGKKLYAATHGRSAYVANIRRPNSANYYDESAPNIIVGGTISDTATLAAARPRQAPNVHALWAKRCYLRQPGDLTSTVSVNGNGSYTSADYTPTAPGTYRWIASYSGVTRIAP